MIEAAVFVLMMLLMAPTAHATSGTRRVAATDANIVEVGDYDDALSDPVDRWNIADRSSDVEMSAALDGLLNEIALNPTPTLRNLESDDELNRERNEVAFDKLIATLWYSPNLSLKKKVAQVLASIDDWSKVERIFRDSGSQIDREKILYAVGHLREDVRHSRYHFDAEYVANLETIERKVILTSSK
jgi:hypothetical protein